MAVSAAMSNQGTLSRYHEQVVDRGHGRLTRPGQRRQGLYRDAEACWRPASRGRALA
jgi:hypothetical protein